MRKEIIEKLASETNGPCVSISMNTHRTYPDNAQDIIKLKNHIKEAQEGITTKFGKHPGDNLLEKLESIEKDIDVNYNLDSLHIFLSDSIREIIKLPLTISRDTIQVSENFAINPLVEALNRTEKYLILLLSRSGVTLFHAVNNYIVEEIKNDDFPITENPYSVSNPEKLSDAKQHDNMVREFLNGVDKLVVKVHNETGMNCLVICTDDNYSHLMQIADKPGIYYGYVPINHNDISPQTIANSAWNVVSSSQMQRRMDIIREMEEAMGQGKTLTDAQEIYRAAKEGRADLLILRDDLHQAVKMTGEFSFEPVADKNIPGANDDIISEIVREVILKKGHVVFTNPEENKSPVNIVLKVRY
jgi:hypothetical protein